MTLSEWAVPAIGLAALVVWLVIIRRALRTITAHRNPPDAARLLTLATITVVALCVAVSALTYPSVIGPDLARAMVIIARIALLVGGVAVLWTGRASEDVE